jgi:hypothetical protein
MADQFSDDELLRLYKNPKSDLSLLNREELGRIDRLTGPVPASEQPELPEGPTTRGYLGNVASDVGGMISGIPTILGAAAKGGYNLLSGNTEREFWKNPRENVGKIVEGARAIGGELVKPYESMDNFLASLYNEPTRIPMDASILLGGAGAGAKAAKLPNIARTLSRAGEAINPVQLVTRPVAAVARAIPRGQIKVGRSLIKRAIKPGLAAVKDTTAYKKGLGLAASEEDMINAFLNHDLSTNVAGVDKGLAAIRSKANQVTQDVTQASQPGVGIYGTSKPAEVAVAKMATDSPFGRQTTPGRAKASIAAEVRRILREHSTPQTVTRQVPGPPSTILSSSGQPLPGPTVPKTVQTGKRIRTLQTPLDLLQQSRAENELVGQIATLGENPNIGREFAAAKGRGAREAVHRKVPTTAKLDKDISELIPVVDALQNMVFASSRRTPIQLYDMLALGGLLRGSPTALAPLVASAGSRGSLTGAVGKSLAKSGIRNANRLSTLPGERTARTGLLVGETTRRLIKDRKDATKKRDSEKEVAEALASIRALMQSKGSE